MNFQTVLISAVTSAFITLLIEFFAKPHFEARKDRILEKYRARRTMRVTSGRIQFLAGVLSAESPKGSQNERRILSDEYTRCRQELYEEALKIENVLTNYGYVMTELEANILFRYCGLIKGLSKSEKLRSDMARQALLFGGPIVDYFYASILLRIRRIIGRVMQKFGKSRKLQREMAQLGWITSNK